MAQIFLIAESQDNASGNHFTPAAGWVSMWQGSTAGGPDSGQKSQHLLAKYQTAVPEHRLQIPRPSWQVSKHSLRFSV